MDNLRPSLRPVNTDCSMQAAISYNIYNNNFPAVLIMCWLSFISCDNIIIEDQRKINMTH